MIILTDETINIKLFVQIKLLFIILLLQYSLLSFALKHYALMYNI